MTFYTPNYYTESQILEMDLKDFVFPFNDDYMNYDGRTHHYILTEKALDVVDSNWKTRYNDKSPNAVRNLLMATSLKFYTYAYQHSRSNNNQINYLIAKRGLKSYPNMFEYREAIKNAMVDLAFYLIDNGDLSRISGVDFESMTSLSIDTIRYEERDYPNRFRQTMLDLGLAYYGRYKFIPSGIGKDW